MDINTPEKLAAALTLLDENISTYKNEVGATADEMTAVSQYLANLTTAIANSALVEEDKKTSTGIKNDVYNGDPNKSATKYPAFAIEPLPFPDLMGDAKGFYSDLKARYKSAKDYTKTIGIALGFEDAPVEKPPISSLVGAADVKDLGGYEYQGDFKKQGMTGMLFQYRVKGTEKWFEAKSAFSSPVVISVDAPSVEGAAVQIEVRCRYLKGNEQVGQWSPIYPLTVNP